MTTKKKIVFVVNPISWTQGKRAILKWIDERINRTLYDYTIVKTQYAGHAEKIAATAAKEKVDIVVAIGGDGTINEIGRALIHTDTALGIIPCGSGNGLARHLQIPLEPKAAIDIINESSVACIDYGKINNIPFFCTCGVGFDAFVSLKFADSGKRGLLTYLENTLHESLSYKPETYEIENEEGTVKASLFPKDGKDIRETVFMAFAQEGCPLLMLYHSRTTLEDVFLELTQGSTPAAAKAMKDGEKKDRMVKRRKKNSQEEAEVNELTEMDEEPEENAVPTSEDEKEDLENDSNL